jgi:hypothetical protein
MSVEDCRQNKTVQQVGDKGVLRKTQQSDIDECAHGCTIFLPLMLGSPRIAGIRLSADMSRIAVTPDVLPGIVPG